MTDDTRRQTIEIRALSKRYGERVVVDGLNLTAFEGQWYIFLGHNGAGKTTTIKMLLGLVPPSGGQARILGHDIRTERQAIHRQVGYMPENLRPYEYLTGREYLLFVGDVHAIPREELKAAIERLLDLMELSPAADSLVQGYSLGMRKKLGFAAALIHEPKVLFLDEPTADLDPRAAGMVRNLIRGLCDRGRTVFMTTHILTHAEQYCDRVGILNHGKLIAEDSPQALREAHGGLDLEALFLKLTGQIDEGRLSRFLEDV